MHFAFASAPAHSAALSPAAAFRARVANDALRSSLGTRPAVSNDENDENDGGLNGWLASSVELRAGLVVQYLRIDPLDADWRDLFAA